MDESTVGVPGFAGLDLGTSIASRFRSLASLTASLPGSYPVGCAGTLLKAEERIFLLGPRSICAVHDASVQLKIPLEADPVAVFIAQELLDRKAAGDLSRGMRANNAREDR